MHDAQLSLFDKEEVPPSRYPVRRLTPAERAIGLAGVKRARKALHS